jgi:hypothetical protein
LVGRLTVSRSHGRHKIENRVVQLTKQEGAQNRPIAFECGPRLLRRFDPHYDAVSVAP